MKLKHYITNIQTSLKTATKQNINFCIKNTINHLPEDLKWAPHNLIAHPLMEICYQIGLTELSEHIHNITMSEDSNGH